MPLLNVTRDEASRRAPTWEDGKGSIPIRRTDGYGGEQGLRGSGLTAGPVKRLGWRSAEGWREKPMAGLGLASETKPAGSPPTDRARAEATRAAGSGGWAVIVVAKRARRAARSPLDAGGSAGRGARSDRGITEAVVSGRAGGAGCSTGASAGTAPVAATMVRRGNAAGSAEATMRPVGRTGGRGAATRMPGTFVRSSGRRGGAGTSAM